MVVNYPPLSSLDFGVPDFCFLIREGGFPSGNQALKRCAFYGTLCILEPFGWSWVEKSLELYKRTQS